MFWRESYNTVDAEKDWSFLKQFLMLFKNAAEELEGGIEGVVEVNLEGIFFKGQVCQFRIDQWITLLIVVTAMNLNLILDHEEQAMCRLVVVTPHRFQIAANIPHLYKTRFSKMKRECVLANRCIVWLS